MSSRQIHREQAGSTRRGPARAGPREVIARAKGGRGVQKLMRAVRKGRGPAWRGVMDERGTLSGLAADSSREQLLNRVSAFPGPDHYST